MVMIVGKTNPKRIGPYYDNGLLAAIHPDARGKEIEDPRSDYAVENITIDMVWDKVVSAVS